MTGKFIKIFQNGRVVSEVWAHNFVPETPDKSSPQEANMQGTIDRITTAAKQAGADFSPALTSIMSKAEALAEQKGITKAQGVLEACMANPALYDQYKHDLFRRAATRWQQ